MSPRADAEHSPHDALHDAVTAVEPPPELEAVYTAYFKHVSRWARALGGLEADVDDLTQEVFLVVRRKLDGYRGPSMKAWLYGITRKTVSDYRRRAFMRRLLSGVTRSLSQAPEPQASPARHELETGGLERWEAQRILQRVLSQMSPLRRTAFILFEIEGYSGEEIAELEQVPLATVYTRLHHARRDFLGRVAALTDPNEQAQASRAAKQDRALPRAQRRGISARPPAPCAPGDLPEGER